MKIVKVGRVYFCAYCELWYPGNVDKAKVINFANSNDILTIEQAEAHQYILWRWQCPKGHVEYTYLNDRSKRIGFHTSDNGAQCGVCHKYYNTPAKALACCKKKVTQEKARKILEETSG